MAISNTPIDVEGLRQDSSASSIQIAGLNTPQGSVAVLIASNDDGGAPDTWSASISDDTGSGWNIAGYGNSANSAPMRSVVAWKQFGTGDASNTVTVNFGVSREYRTLCVVVYDAGGDVVSQVDYDKTDQATLGDGTKSQNIFGPDVTALTGDLVLSLTDTYRDSTQSALTGYTLQVDAGPAGQKLSAIASRVVSSGGDYDVGVNYVSSVPSTHGYTVHGLVLRATAGGGGAAVPVFRHHYMVMKR